MLIKDNHIAAAGGVAAAVKAARAGAPAHSGCRWRSSPRRCGRRPGGRGRLPPPRQLLPGRSAGSSRASEDGPARGLRGHRSRWCARSPRPVCSASPWRLDTLRPWADISLEVGPGPPPAPNIPRRARRAPCRRRGGSVSSGAQRVLEALRRAEGDPSARGSRSGSGSPGPRSGSTSRRCVPGATASRACPAAATGSPVPDRLYPEEILAGLPTSWLAREIHYFDSTDSTNRAPFELARRRRPRHRGDGRGPDRRPRPSRTLLLLPSVLEPLHLGGASPLPQRQRRGHDHPGGRHRGGRDGGGDSEAGTRWRSSGPMTSFSMGSRPRAS